MPAVIQHKQVTRAGRHKVRLKRLLDAPGCRLAILKVDDLCRWNAQRAKELDQRGVAAILL
jgi:hypothetical protein